MGQGHRRGTCRTLNGQASQSWARLLVSSVRRCALSPGAGASFTFCHLRRGGCMKCGTHFAAVAWRLYARSLNRKSALDLLRVVGVVVGRRVLFRPIAPRGCESWLTARESLTPECRLEGNWTAAQRNAGRTRRLLLRIRCSSRLTFGRKGPSGIAASLGPFWRTRRW